MRAKVKYLLVSAAVALSLAFAAASAWSQDQGKMVDVTLKEWSIEMPKELPAGTVMFMVTNKGEHEHNFEILGSGIDKKFDDDLKPGQNNTMTVTLDPGTYTVMCPVGMHADEGMKLELNVTGKTGGGA